jgi:hypothetical protein
MLQDPDQLRKLGIFSKAQTLLASVEKLGIGTVFPYYSPLSVNGIALKGVDLAVNPGKFYGALTAGEITQAAFVSDTFQHPYRSRMISGKVGVGKNAGTHLYATAMLVRESLHPKRQDSALGHFAPRSNLLYGLEGKWVFWRDRIILEGEWMRSLLESSAGSAYIPGLDTLSWVQPLSNRAPDSGRSLVSAGAGNTQPLYPADGQSDEY